MHFDFQSSLLARHVAVSVLLLALVSLRQDQQLKQLRQEREMLQAQTEQAKHSVLQARRGTKPSHRFLCSGYRHVAGRRIIIAPGVYPEPEAAGKK